MPVTSRSGTAEVVAAYRALTDALDAARDSRGLAWVCAMRLLDRHGLVGVVPAPDDDDFLAISLRHLDAARMLIEHERAAQRRLFPAPVEDGEDAPF